MSLSMSRGLSDGGSRSSSGGFSGMARLWVEGGIDIRGTTDLVSSSEKSKKSGFSSFLSSIFMS